MSRSEASRFVASFVAAVAAFASIASFAPVARASDLAVAVERVSGDGGRPPAIELSLAWKNAWRNERNHDAAWVVLRDRRAPGGGPLKLAAEGHRALEGEPGARIVPSEDGLGAFVSVAAPHRGDVRWRLSLALDPAASGSAIAAADVLAFAVEMVYVPAGPFELGDDAEGVVALSAFFSADEDGEPEGPYHVGSEAAIEVGSEPGMLDYRVGREPSYNGDRKGPIPAEFPKGTRAFFVMKYELRQGQYAAFLDALPPAWQTRRSNAGAKGEEDATNSIARGPSGFVASAPERACNFVTWGDTCAFADWLALRPMTELEFEKACRGPTRPVAGDYPWGRASRDGLERIVQPSRDLALATAADERALDDASKVRLGASYYWVMDLSGGVWERVVSAGNPAGRRFRGSHGDGRLDPKTGDATNEDWPHGAGETVEGVGYRGGAEYFSAVSLTNPNSPVAARTYAAWNGADRTKTYSARACRTAPY